MNKLNPLISIRLIINWKFDKETKSVVRIHGTSDRLIPLKGEAIEVVDGGHFMIVDKAAEISEIITNVIFRS